MTKQYINHIKSYGDFVKECGDGTVYTSASVPTLADAPDIEVHFSWLHKLNFVLLITVAI